MGVTAIGLGMSPAKHAQMRRYLKEKFEALSPPLTVEKIDAYYLAWNGHKLTDFCRGRRPNNPTEAEELFWGAIHKAVTGLESLPLEHRKASKAWLTAHGLQSHDDGDLS